jgi:hypothetical protein
VLGAILASALVSADVQICSTPNSEFVLVDVVDQRTCGWSSLAVMIPQVAKLLDLTNVPDGIGTLAPHRVLTIERLYLTAFFDQHLRHRPSPLLTKPSPRIPEVLFVP